MADTPPLRDLHLAFFDGEDLGDVDGYPYAEGSRHYVAQGPADVDRVIALDRAGGRNMRLNSEGNSLLHEASRDVFIDLFQRGRAAGRDAFFENQERWIYSDHGPFLDAGIPALCLIDIDYPQWHTHADLPDACHPDPLGQVGATLLEFLRG